MASKRGTKRKTPSTPETVDEPPGQPPSRKPASSKRSGQIRSYFLPASPGSESGGDGSGFDFSLDDDSSEDKDRAKRGSPRASKPKPKGKVGQRGNGGVPGKPRAGAAGSKATGRKRPVGKTDGGAPTDRREKSPTAKKSPDRGKSTKARPKAGADKKDSDWSPGEAAKPHKGRGIEGASPAMKSRPARTASATKTKSLKDIGSSEDEEEDYENGKGSEDEVSSDSGASADGAEEADGRKDGRNGIQDRRKNKAGGGASGKGGAGAAKGRKSGGRRPAASKVAAKAAAKELLSSDDGGEEAGSEADGEAGEDRNSQMETGEGRSRKAARGGQSDDHQEADGDYSPASGDGGESSGSSFSGDDEPVKTAKGKGKAKGKKKATSGSTGGGRGLSTAKPAKLAGDVESVLKIVRRLREGMGNKRASSEQGGRDGAGSSAPLTLVELGMSGDVTEVKEMAAGGVMNEIERIVVEVAESIMSGKGFSFRVPTRSSGNQKYVEELDRIVLGDKVSQRNFVSTMTARKTAITTRVIQLVHQVLDKGIHITKRDMFYTDVKLFKEQGESDAVLEDVACMVGCTRSCLNVVASDKGLVIGRVTFLEDGDLIDCTRMGVGGKAIPPYMDKISTIRSDADFVLLVEKEAAYMRLAEDRFYQKYPCIVITAKGQPDVATRLFLKRLKRELRIPVMGLVDSDPYGLKILSVYMSGSKNMSYDSASLTTPDIKWLGVRPSDLDRYKIPEQCRLDMTEHDIKTGKELLREDFIKKNPDWYSELELMIKTRKKAEIQSLSAFGFQYLTETYLPQKLQNGDWV